MIWSGKNLPYFKNIAESKWGDQWENECASFLSKTMQKQVETWKVWDVYRIASVYAARPSIFLPNFDKLSDSAKELCRRAAQIKLMYRQSCDRRLSGWRAAAIAGIDFII